MNYKNSYLQNRSFEYKINHLQSFIGMPMWNGRNPTLSEIREFDRRLLEQQIEAIKPKKIGMFRKLFDRLKANMDRLISNVKTKHVNQTITNQKITEVECCG